MPLKFAAGTHWVINYATGTENGEVFLGYQSIKMVPADFAKSAQIILDHGKWQAKHSSTPTMPTT